jgi:hypothetical protein
MAIIVFQGDHWPDTLVVSLTRAQLEPHKKPTKKNFENRLIDKG